MGLKGLPEQLRALGSSWEVGGGWAGRYTYLDAGAGCAGLVPGNVHKGHCRVLCGVTLWGEGSVTGSGGADQAPPDHRGTHHPSPLQGLAPDCRGVGGQPHPQVARTVPTPPGSQRPQGRGWPGAVDGSRGAMSFPGDTGTPGSGRGWTRRRPPGGGPERVRAGRSSSRLWGAGVRPSTHPPLTNTPCLASLTERRLHKGKGRLGYGHTARTLDRPPACTLEGTPPGGSRPWRPPSLEGPVPWRAHLGSAAA